MESRRLEIVLHSAKDLFDVKIFGTMDPYATLWIDGGAQEAFKQYKTKVAKKAGTCPVWDYRMEFQLHSMNSSHSLFCEIQHDGKLFDRMIGEVQVPFKDLLVSKQKTRYPVKIPSGEVQGEIILSHKLSEEVISNKDGISSTKKKNGTGNRNRKVHSPANRVQGKKKNGPVKKFAKTVATGVVTQTIVKGVTALALAGTVGAAGAVGAGAIGVGAGAVGAGAVGAGAVGAGDVVATEDNVDHEDEDDDVEVGQGDDEEDDVVQDDDEEDDVVQDDDEEDDVVQDDDEEDVVVQDDEEDDDNEDDYDDEDDDNEDDYDDEDDDNEDDYDDDYADEYY